MKVTVCAFALLVPCCLAASEENRFYLGVSIGTAMIDERLNETEIDDNGASGQVYLGYQFLRPVAVEFSYTIIDDLESDDYRHVGRIRKDIYKADSPGLGLVLNPGMMSLDTNRGSLKISPFGTLGWHHWDVEERTMERNFGKVNEDNHDGDDFYYGLGLDILITDDLYLRMEWRRMEFRHDIADADVDMFWMGVKEHFGFSR